MQTKHLLHRIAHAFGHGVHRAGVGRLCMGLPLLAALCCAGHTAQAGPLRPGEILVADIGIEEATDGAIFRVDPVTGDRAIISGRGVGSGPELFNPMGITLGVDGQIYVTDRVALDQGGDAPVIYRIDPASGVRDIVSGPERGVGPSLNGDLSWAIAFRTDGKLLIATEQPELGGPLEDGAVFIVDPLTGDRSVLTGPSAGDGPYLRGAVALREDPSGNLVLVDSALVAVDAQTGDRARITLPGAFLGSSDAAVRDLENVMVADFLGARIYSVNRDHGTSVVVSGPGSFFPDVIGDGPGLYPYSIEFEDESALVSLAVVDDSFVGLVRVDVATGNRTVVSGGGVGEGPDFLGLGYLTIVPAVVPEPGTLALATLGALALGVIRCRAKRLSAARHARPALGCRRVAWRALVGSVSALLLAAPVAQAGPLRPGEILVAIAGFTLENFTPEGPADGAVFVVDPATGNRSVLSSADIGGGPALRDPLGIALGPDGNVYVSDRTFDTAGQNLGLIHRIDPSTGNRTEVSGPAVGGGPNIDGGFAVGPTGMAFGPDGYLYVSQSHSAVADATPSGSIIRVDVTTGERQLVSASGMGSGHELQRPAAMNFDHDGQLFVSDSREGLFLIDIETGDRTRLRGPGLYGAAALLDDASYVYSLHSFVTLMFHHWPDTETSLQLTGLPHTAPIQDPASLALLDQNSAFVAGQTTDLGLAIFEIDLDTSDWRLVSGSGVGVGPEFGEFGMMAVVPVPEPATRILLLACTVVLACPRACRRCTHRSA